MRHALRCLSSPFRRRPHGGLHPLIICSQRGRLGFGRGCSGCGVQARSVFVAAVGGGEDGVVPIAARAISAHSGRAMRRHTASHVHPNREPIKRMNHPSQHVEHISATAADWGLSQPKERGEDDRKRPLAAVATDLNGRLKQCCKSAESPSVAAREMGSHLTLFARYGLPNPKAIQLVRDMTVQAFTPKKR